jgi:hypothetical protein
MGQETTLDWCLQSVGFPRAYAETQAWSAPVTLTVSEELDASRIVLEQEAATHAQFLIYSVLRTMRFYPACAGKRLAFRVLWEPSPDGRPDGRYGISKRGNQVIVTSYPARSRTRRSHGGPLEITTEDLEALRSTPSIRQFLRKKGLNLDW